MDDARQRSHSLLARIQYRGSPDEGNPPGPASNTRVYDLWANLGSQSSWALGRTLPSSNPGSQLTSVAMLTSEGYGNYNAFFFSLELQETMLTVAMSFFMAPTVWLVC